MLMTDLAQFSKLDLEFKTSPTVFASQFPGMAGLEVAKETVATKHNGRGGEFQVQ